LPLIGSAAGLVNAVGINVLRLAPGVAYIHFDALVKAHADTSAGTSLATAYPATVNADRVWSLGRTGQGVTVAVLDSGHHPGCRFCEPDQSHHRVGQFRGCPG